MSAKSSDSNKPIGWKAQTLGAARTILWVAICFVGSQVLVSIVLVLLRALGVPEETFYQNTAVMTVRLAALIVMVVMLLGLPKLHWGEGASRKILGLERSPRWSDIGWGIVGLIAAFVGAVIVLWLTPYLMPWVNVSEPQNLGVSPLGSGPEMALVFLVLVVVGPIIEEVVFRGYLYGRLRQQRIAFWPTTLIVSALFALAHWQWNVALDVFVLSIIMCVLRQKTGSLWPSIVVHMLKNGIAFYFTFVVLLTNGL